MTFDGRLIAAALGFGLVLTLSCRLRGFPSPGRGVLLAVAVFFSLLGLELLGFRDGRGVASFLIGMVGAAFVGRDAWAARPAPGGRRARWLALSAVPIGLGVGAVLFGVWYATANESDRIDIAEHATMFAGFGAVAGVMTGAVVSLLTWGDSTTARSEPKAAPVDAPSS